MLVPCAFVDIFVIVNRVVRRHNTSTYDELAIRAIAEQIDTLYWEASAPDLDEEDELFNDDELVRHGDDFTTQRQVRPAIILP